MFYIKILLLLLGTAFCIVHARNSSDIFHSNGNVSVAVILCGDPSSYTKRTLVSSAIWVSERITFLKILHPLNLGLSVYDACSEQDLLKIVFDIYQKRNETYTIGIVTDQEYSDKVQKFVQILGLRIKRLQRFNNFLLKAAAQVLRSLGWRHNVTMVMTDEQILDMFYVQAKKQRICINKCYILEHTSSVALNATAEDPLLFFGTASDINDFVAEGQNDTYFNNTLFVSLDGDVPEDLPERSFLILPPHASTKSFQVDGNILPSPLLLEIADPLMNFALEMKNLLQSHCNDSSYKINCVKTSPHLVHLFPIIAPIDIFRSLKIDPLLGNFVYDVFQVESAKGMDENTFLKPFKKVFTYHIFGDNLTLVDDTMELPLFNSTFPQEICTRQLIIRRDNSRGGYNYYVTFRSDSWIYAFLSLSFLGILFCIAILTFLLVALWQRRVLEGNPAMTLLLLFAVMLVFAAVLPFGIENTNRIHKGLCITKTFAVTLSYTAVFSLLLSRSIVLASAAREVGFMSHIAGFVQSFLCLFIFGVQAALSLHVVPRCNDIFTHSLEFLYLMSYNIMLLVLLVCLTPLIYKSQRNYREGKYFTIAIIFIALVWSVWLTCFSLLCNEWKEMVLCLGLVATGGVCLGAIFIPRTYLMTIALERDKITSAMPSLTTAASVADLYRSRAQQPIYDCINFAAVNAAAIARAGVAPITAVSTLQQPDLYSCPALPEDLNLELRGESPVDTDKITRF